MDNKAIEKLQSVYFDALDVSEDLKTSLRALTLDINVSGLDFAVRIALAITWKYPWDREHVAVLLSQYWDAFAEAGLTAPAILSAIRELREERRRMAQMASSHLSPKPTRGLYGPLIRVSLLKQEMLLRLWEAVTEADTKRVVSSDEEKSVLLRSGEDHRDARMPAWFNIVAERFDGPWNHGIPVK